MKLHGGADLPMNMLIIFINYIIISLESDLRNGSLIR